MIPRDLGEGVNDGHELCRGYTTCYLWFAVISTTAVIGGEARSCLRWIVFQELLDVLEIKVQQTQSGGNGGEGDRGDVNAEVRGAAVLRNNIDRVATAVNCGDEKVAWLAGDSHAGTDFWERRAGLSGSRRTKVQGHT